MKDKLEVYARLKNDIRKLEDELEPLKDQITTYMLEHDGEEIECDVGNFTLSQRRTYQYSEEIKKKEESLKKAKKEAEARGEAEYSVTNVLVFKKKNEQGAEGI